MRTSFRLLIEGQNALVPALKIVSGRMSHWCDQIAFYVQPTLAL